MAPPGMRACGCQDSSTVGLALVKAAAKNHGCDDHQDVTTLLQ